jgi:hypothetical protein
MRWTTLRGIDAALVGVNVKVTMVPSELFVQAAVVVVFFYLWLWRRCCFLEIDLDDGEFTI